MKVVVTGSRTWTDSEQVEGALAGLRMAMPKDEVLLVIAGGAPGADMIAADWAFAHESYNVEVEVVKADWAKYGKRAGPIRNIEMLGMEPDLVLAFRVSGPSPGTDDTIRKASKRGIPVQVFNEEE